MEAVRRCWGSWQVQRVWTLCSSGRAPFEKRGEGGRSESDKPLFLVCFAPLALVNFPRRSQPTQQPLKALSTTSRRAQCIALAFEPSSAGVVVGGCEGTERVEGTVRSRIELSSDPCADRTAF
jgi:hypothetical protein